MDPIALCEMIRKIFLVNNKKLFVLDTYVDEKCNANEVLIGKLNSIN